MRNDFHFDLPLARDPENPDSDGDVIARGAFVRTQGATHMESSWISVEERLPDEGHVLASSVYKGRRQPTEIAEYVAGSKHQWYATDREGEPISGVTHWMPLPEPPK